MASHHWHPHLDAMNQLYRADWFDPRIITADGYYRVPAVENQPVVFKLPDPHAHAGEYFLVENRQQIGYDAFLPDEGLAIYHIDENVSASGGAYYKEAVEIEPASGLAIPMQYGAYLWDGAGLKWGAEFANNRGVINS